MQQVSTAQEDKMDIKSMSWKEVVELYADNLTKDYPEMLWSGEYEEPEPEPPSFFISPEGD